MKKHKTTLIQQRQFFMKHRYIYIRTHAISAAGMELTTMRLRVLFIASAAIACAKSRKSLRLYYIKLLLNDTVVQDTRYRYWSHSCCIKKLKISGFMALYNC